MAEELILGTLEALGFEDRDAFERGLDHLAPLATYLLTVYGFGREHLVLNCGPLTLRVRFVYDQTDAERDDLSVPFVAFVDESDLPGPTLTITTKGPVAGSYLLRCVERAEGEGLLSVELRTRDAPVDEDEEDGGRIGEDISNRGDQDEGASDDHQEDHR
jgi:hypothetical protein